MSEKRAPDTNKRRQMFAFAWIAAICATMLLSLDMQAVFTPPGTFLAKPYLQLGAGKDGDATVSHDILFLVHAENFAWEVEYKTGTQKNWTKVKDVTKTVIKNAQPEPITQFKATLTKLPAGKTFDYRVLRNGIEVFTATAKTQVRDNQPFKFIVAGDLAAGTSGQKRIAALIGKEAPDMWVMPGDLAYNFGCLSDYFSRFFPVYNADENSETVGAPIMRSTLCIPVIGNHDIAQTRELTPTDFNRFDDALGYFLVWSSPLNGPLKQSTGANFPTIAGAEARLATFTHGAGKRYPQMANYSFDFGNTHWIVLDGNHYMNWSDPELRKWVADDLAKAKNAKWKFATFHQPAFSLDMYHREEQRMRLICEELEKGGVDIVFAGHAHNYQRSYPLHFKATTGKVNRNGTVDGTIILDKKFDNTAKTKPDGIIHIVTGAGGARLYSSTSSKEVMEMGDFLTKVHNDDHSYTVCKSDGGTLTVSQITDQGKQIDKFVLKKD